MIDMGVGSYGSFIKDSTSSHGGLHAQSNLMNPLVSTTPAKVNQNTQA